MRLFVMDVIIIMVGGDTNEVVVVWLHGWYPVEI